MTKLADCREDELFERVAGITESARGHVVRTANSAMVHAYWLIDGEIVEVEQHSKQRAGCGEALMNHLAERLIVRFGKRFGRRTLRRLRLFYLTFPKGSALLSDPRAVRKWTAPLSKSIDPEIRTALLSKSATIERALFPPHLGWTHYLVLMRIENPTARGFYEIEAALEKWASRESSSAKWLRSSSNALPEAATRTRSWLSRKRARRWSSWATSSRTLLSSISLTCPNATPGLSATLSRPSSIALRSSCWNLAKASVSRRARSG